MNVLVRDDPKLLDDSGEILKSQGRGWRLDPRLWAFFSTWHKTCQVAYCLMCFGVGMSAFCFKSGKKKRKSELSTTYTIVRVIKVEMTSEFLFYLGLRMHAPYASLFSKLVWMSYSLLECRFSCSLSGHTTPPAPLSQLMLTNEPRIVDEFEHIV